jgi:hypothetical protein
MIQKQVQNHSWIKNNKTGHGEMRTKREKLRSQRTTQTAKEIREKGFQISLTYR